ncbi:MAG: hypothetical protein Ct9H90mP17_1360 [Actinomycetota bacterium]|nr:MAG: hypothetical protein Ct9H90mP17_1360 [Actinomycetota bacterium]
MSKEQLTGAELVIRGLEYLNVSTVFGVPGGAIYLHMIHYTIAL